MAHYWVAFVMLMPLVFVVLLFSSLMYRVAGSPFFYFSYGSNLLNNRILIKNPSAVFYGPASLSGYRLDFHWHLPMWNGAMATIVPDTNSTVWGDLWLIEWDQMKYLDKQAGVDRGWSYPKWVNAQTRSLRTGIGARTYIDTHPPTKLRPGQALPHHRRPSGTYLKVIILGAILSDLPAYYIDYLKTFKTNHKKATKKMLKALGSVNLVYDFVEDRLMPTYVPSPPYPDK